MKFISLINVDFLGTFEKSDDLYVPLKPIGGSENESENLLEFDESKFEPKEYEKKSIEELNLHFKGKGNKWAVLLCTGIMSLLRFSFFLFVNIAIIIVI